MLNTQRTTLQGQGSKLAVQPFHANWPTPRRCLNKYVHMVFRDFHRIYPELIFLGNLLKHLFQILRNFPTQYVFPVLRYPHQVVLRAYTACLVLLTPMPQLYRREPFSGKHPYLALQRATFLPPASWRVSSGVFYESLS